MEKRLGNTDLECLQTINSVSPTDMSLAEIVCVCVKHVAQISGTVFNSSRFVFIFPV